MFLNAPDCYDKLGVYAQINPPIREKEHAQVLWNALINNHIHCVVTDHAPHTKEDKSKPFGKAPSGMPGVQTVLSLMLNQVNQGKCSLEQVIRWTSTNTASIFNIENKGQIKVGYDADLVLIDLKGRKVISDDEQVTKCGWSAFSGVEVQGIPIATYVNGQKVYREGDFFEEIKGKEVNIKAAV